MSQFTDPQPQGTPSTYSYEALFEGGGFATLQGSIGHPDGEQAADTAALEILDRIAQVPGVSHVNCTKASSQVQTATTEIPPAGEPV
jgi:hypothetical protein